MVEISGCMSSELSIPIKKLIGFFTVLPGIGPKTAERLVFHFMKQKDSFLDDFSHALLEVKEKTASCKRCFSFAELNAQQICSICLDTKRDSFVLCVMSETTDLLALEKTGEYEGKYHVLGGTINTLRGIYPESLTIADFLKRVKEEKVREVILALNPDATGEATSLYLWDKLKDCNVRVSRLGLGLPMGADVKYADALTLSNALKGRRSL